MAIFDPKTRKFLCECGCGKEINPWVKFAPGHHMRVKEYKDSFIERMVERNTDCFHTEEHNQHISEGVRRAYEVDPTLARRIGEANLGSVRSSETVDRMSVARYEFYSSEEGQRVKEEFSSRYSGEGSWNWKGGYLGGYGYGWSAIRELIIIRDNYTCQGCGYKGKAFSDLVVHHIDEDTDNIKEANLITLCQRCNVRARFCSKESRAYYTRRVKEICGQLEKQG